MTLIHTDIAEFRQNLTGFLDQAASSQDAISIHTESGQVVLLSEEEYRGLMETLRLFSVPGMKEKLLEGMRTPIEECDEFEW